MSRQSSSRVPDVDPKSPAGVALTSAVQDKLRAYLGADYVDRSLAQVTARAAFGVLLHRPCAVPWAPSSAGLCRSAAGACSLAGENLHGARPSSGCHCAPCIAARCPRRPPELGPPLRALHRCPLPAAPTAAAAPSRLQYIVIMLAHKTGQQGVGDNLVEFLGEVDAREVASWWAAGGACVCVCVCVWMLGGGGGLELWRVQAGLRGHCRADSHTLPGCGWDA
jgi:hypothetical protein